jgi:hypothetical protein
LCANPNINIEILSIVKPYRAERKMERKGKRYKLQTISVRDVIKRRECCKAEYLKGRSMGIQIAIKCP